MIVKTVLEHHFTYSNAQAISEIYLVLKSIVKTRITSRISPPGDV